jgi:hypothetical protein
MISKHFTPRNNTIIITLIAAAVLNDRLRLCRATSHQTLFPLVMFARGRGKNVSLPHC